MSLEEGGNKLPEPTREFYLSDPRSAVLRQHCIEMIHAFYRLITGGLPLDESASAYAELYTHKVDLDSLGVVGNMHVIEPPHPREYFVADSVVASEFIAGQLINLLDQPFASATEAIPTIQEFSEGSMETGYLIESANLHERERSFLVASITVEDLKRRLNYTDEDELPKPKQ